MVADSAGEAAVRWEHEEGADSAAVRVAREEAVDWAAAGLALQASEAATVAAGCVRM